MSTELPSRELTEYLYRKASSRLLPLSGTFELTPTCNFSCRMCYVRKTAREVRESPRPILTLDDWLRIARQARDGGMLYLLLTGGEPLTWPDFWKLYEELIGMGMLISINTNGSLIDEAAAARFRRLPPRRINITLYGAGEGAYTRLCRAEGAYARVDRAIGLLRSAGVTVKLNCSLTPDNAGDLEKIVAYAAERELRLDVATYMFPPVRREPGLVGVNERFTPEEASRARLRCIALQSGEGELRRYLADVRRGCVEPPGLDESCVDPVDGRIRCRAGKASFWITWDGWLTPCGLMSDPRVDLAASDFMLAWRSLAEQAAAVRLSGVCASCPNARICHPCAAMALAETGSSAGIPRYLCRQTQELRRAAEELYPGGVPDTINI